MEKIAVDMEYDVFSSCKVATIYRMNALKKVSSNRPSDRFCTVAVKCGSHLLVLNSLWPDLFHLVKIDHNLLPNFSHREMLINTLFIYVINCCFLCCVSSLFFLICRH